MVNLIFRGIVWCASIAVMAIAITAIATTLVPIFVVGAVLYLGVRGLFL